VEAEIGSTYNPDRARERTERIYETVSRLIEVSKQEEIPTSQAADRLAEERIASVRKVKNIYSPG